MSDPQQRDAKPPVPASESRVDPRNQHSHAANPGTVDSDQGTAAPAMRASDLDRRKVATVLHEALGRGQLTINEFDERTAEVWAATHRADLEKLTSDLSETSPLASGAVVAPDDILPPASRRVTGENGPVISVGMFGGFRRTGVWTLPPKFTALAIMGGGVIDLRQANLGADKVTIYAVAIMGGVEIIVPDDVIIREEGIGVMGSFSDERRWKDGVRKPPPGSPVITITGVALMGGVTITRRPPSPQEVDRR